MTRIPHSNIFLRIGAFVVTVVIWWAVATSNIFGSLAITTPQNAFGQLYVLLINGTLIGPFERTFSEIFLALILSLAIGSIGGLLMGMFETVNGIFDPYLMIMLVVPMSAVLPLISLIFGLLSIIPAIVFAFLIAVFPIMSIIRVAVRNLNPKLVTVARTMGASSNQLFLYVHLRAAIRPILSALRIGLILVVAGVLIEELYVQQPNNPGIGYLISSFSTSFEVGKLYAVIFLIAMITIIMNDLLFYIEHKYPFTRKIKT